MHLLCKKEGQGRFSPIFVHRVGRGGHFEAMRQNDHFSFQTISNQKKKKKISTKKIFGLKNFFFSEIFFLPGAQNIILHDCLGPFPVMSDQTLLSIDLWGSGDTLCSNAGGRVSSFPCVCMHAITLI